MNDLQLPPPPPSGSPQTTPLARLWSSFRGLPIWAQVVLWILAWPFLAALLFVSSPRPKRWQIAAAVVVLLLAAPVWVASLVGIGDGTPSATVLAEEPAPAASEPAGEDEPEPEPEPELSEVLAAELAAICEDALAADDRIAGRTVVRQTSQQLARGNDFSATEISRAVQHSCGVQVDELGPRAAPEPESEPEAEPEPESEPEPEPEPKPLPAADIWTVENIVDGDTVDVRNASGTERVRVIGIDTPERGECGFGPASSALGTLILGQEVQLTAGASDDRDHYDRILRYIDIGNTDAGLLLIEQGLAIARYDSRDGYGRHPRQDTYVDADSTTEHVCGVTFASATSGSSSSSSSSSSSDTSQPPAPPPPSTGTVKKSDSDICHAPGTTYYDRTKNFTPYDTVDACLASGGRLPKR